MPFSCRWIPCLSQALEGVRMMVMKARASNILMLVMAVGGLEDQLLLDCFPSLSLRRPLVGAGGGYK